MKVLLDTNTPSELPAQSVGIDVAGQGGTGKQLQVRAELQHRPLGRGLTTRRCGSCHKGATAIRQLQQCRVLRNSCGYRPDGHHDAVPAQTVFEHVQQGALASRRRPRYYVQLARDESYIPALPRCRVEGEEKKLHRLRR